MWCVLFIIPLNTIIPITAYSALFGHKLFNIGFNTKCPFSFRFFALQIFSFKNRQTKAIAKYPV